MTKFDMPTPRCTPHSFEFPYILNNHSLDDIFLLLSAPTFIRSFNFPTIVTEIDQTHKNT